MNNIKIQIFGSQDCEICKSVVKAFEHHSVGFEYIDANSPQNESICDKFKVDELPHIQALFADNDKVFYTHIGYVSPTVFVKYLTDHTSQIKSFFDVNKIIASKTLDIQKIKQERNINAGKPCNSCGKKTK
jgi:glutaredoxin